jgi:uncharacterized protein (TIGR03437 family)
MRSIATAVLFCVASFVLSAQQNTTTTLTASPNPANPSDIIVFTIAVTPVSATGNVSISVGGSALVTALGMPGNTASFQMQLPVGSYSVQASYNGDQNDKASMAVLTQVVTTQPVPKIDGIENVGTGWPTAGSAASIFGTFPGIATSTADGSTLPYSLDGISVLIDGVRAPLYFVSASQINFQVPWKVVDQNATINVTNGVWNLTFTNSVLASWPGLFSLILHSADYSLVTSESPAVDGEVVLIYATGLGPVSNTPVDGTPAPDAPLAVTKNPPTVAIDGQAASVLWSGLAPGFVGLYQINVRVPMGLHGNNSVGVTLDDAPSNTLTLAIK